MLKQTCNGTLYWAPAHTAMAAMQEESVDVAFIDSPYNIQKAVSSLPTYSKSQSIIEQRWEDFSASWDVIQDYWEFTRTWLMPLRRVLKPHGSLFTTGTYHNIPVLQLMLKELGFHIVQWISWCKPNSFPNREMQEMVKANEVVIWARRDKEHRHVYNVERAKDYAMLDYWRLRGELPRENNGQIKRTNLRDFWIINNDARAAQDFPFLVHGAKKPPELVARCIDIALPEEGGVVLDPFFGSGTTGYVAKYLSDWTMTPREMTPQRFGIALYLEYVRMCELRLECSHTALDGGLSLPANERKKIATKAGDWAPYLLDGQLPAMMMPEAVRMWDRPRSTLSRPNVKGKELPFRNGG